VNDSIGSKPVGKRRGSGSVKQNPGPGPSGPARNEGCVFAGGGGSEAVGSWWWAGLEWGLSGVPGADEAFVVEVDLDLCAAGWRCNSTHHDIQCRECVSVSIERHWPGMVGLAVVEWAFFGLPLV